MSHKMTEPGGSASAKTPAFEAGAAARARWLKLAGAGHDALMSSAQFDRVISPGMDILEVGFGMGEFAARLGAALPDTWGSITYHGLDAGDGGAARLAARLRTPLTLGEVHQGSVIGGAVPDRRYDIVCAVHAFYDLPWDQLTPAMARLVALVELGGGLMMFQAARVSLYHRLYEEFVAATGEGGRPYVAAEDLFTELPDQFQTAAEISYDHVIPVDDSAALEIYLQRVCRDSERRLQDFMAISTLRGILNAHRAGDTYRLPQLGWVMGDNVTIKSLAGLMDPKTLYA